MLPDAILSVVDFFVIIPKGANPVFHPQLQTTVNKFIIFTFITVKFSGKGKVRGGQIEGEGGG